jgi:hypothetical protein
MHKRVLMVFVVPLALLCTRCAQLDSQYYYYRAQALALVSPSPHYSYYSNHRHSHYSERVRTAHNHSTLRPSTTTAVADDRANPPGSERVAAERPAPASASPTTLTMAGDSGDRAHARSLLSSVDSQLDRVHSGHLSASEKESYTRASQLAQRARRALADDDCAAASSLAAKASSLAAGLGGR